MVRLGRATLTLNRVGEQLILSLQAPSPSTALAPRERSAALLFAAGHSYKEIARMLALSPATVRTYLRNCYLQLGVRSKVELGSILRLSLPLEAAAGVGRPGANKYAAPPHLQRAVESRR